MPYFAVAFGLCAIAALTQMILIDLIRTRLSARHPETFRALMDASGPGPFVMTQAVSRFVFKRRDRELNDRALTGLTRICQAMNILCMLAGLGAAAAILTTRK